ncbi:MAG: HindIII family type II restriction endonuclease [Holosporales bacterium]|jgi:type II restriction enzyme|nr:HindIII family type II restriction endonuclease [Holosporales bacterium]
MFKDLIDLINVLSRRDFANASNDLIEYVNNAKDFADILEQIGTIPESIKHDSTEEKLFAKASDAVLARAFRELGLKATVIKERGDSADVAIESSLYGYAAVADAKAFRMSRTAKNQKDFKIAALSSWKQDADYAILCAPYFQYPRFQSQIYSQSIDYNVCLFSWEHLIFMISKGIKESLKVKLSDFWNFGEIYSHRVLAFERKKYFMDKFNESITNALQIDKNIFADFLKSYINKISERSVVEKTYWKEVKSDIQNYSKEKAIKELLKAMKIDEKIFQIDAYVEGARYD